MPTALPPGITYFQDNDRGFYAWLERNPGSYFINSARNPKPTYLVLHRPTCAHFTANPALHWTKDYVKYCSTNRAELEEWATGTIGGDVTTCTTCLS